MRLYITRHGRTIWNDQKRLQGFMDSPLTQEGIQMAKDLSKRIKELNIDAIITSDLKRAKDTAFYIKSGNDIPIFYIKELREISFGSWEGMPLDEVKEKNSMEYEKFTDDPLNYDNGTGETYQKLVERMKKALDMIERFRFDTVLVVSHGIAIKALITILENRDLKDISKLPVIKGCSLLGYDIQQDSIVKIMDEDLADYRA